MRAFLAYDVQYCWKERATKTKGRSFLHFSISARCDVKGSKKGRRGRRHPSKKERKEPYFTWMHTGEESATKIDSAGTQSKECNAAYHVHAFMLNAV